MNTKSLIAGIAVVAGISVAQTTHAQVGFSSQTSLQVFPKKARYARGEVVTVVYTVIGQFPGGFRSPLSGMPIQIGDWWNTGWTTALNRVTNQNGQVSMTYRIPTNPNWDNISLVGVTARVNPFPMSSVSWRIPIGN